MGSVHELHRRVGALRVDPEYRARRFASACPPVKPKVGNWGQLQEWMADRDDPKDQPRHASHLFAVYPGRQIPVLATPELAAAASFRSTARGDKATGWAWRGGSASGRGCRTATRPTRCCRTCAHPGKGSGMITARGRSVRESVRRASAVPDRRQFRRYGGDCGDAAAIAGRRVHLLPALPKAWPTDLLRGSAPAAI